MRRSRSSAKVKTMAAVKPTAAAAQGLNAKGCQAQESATTAATNAARAIQEVVPPARGKSKWFLFSANDASALRVEECATSLFVRLIRPHRIPESLQNRTASRRGGWRCISAARYEQTNDVCIYPGLSYVKKCEPEEAERKYQNQESGSSANVEARHTRADGAEKVRGDCSDGARDAIGEDRIVAVGSVDCGDVADGDTGDIGDIDHGYIHGDDTDDWSECSADEDFAFISKGTMNAVAVAGGENCNF